MLLQVQRCIITSLTARVKVDADARLVAFLVEVFQGLPCVFTLLEADESVARSLFLLLIVDLVFVILTSFHHLAADEFAKGFKETLQTKFLIRKVLTVNRGILTLSSSLEKLGFGKFLTNKLLNFLENSAVVDVEFPATLVPRSCGVLNYLTVSSNPRSSNFLPFI